MSTAINKMFNFSDRVQVESLNHRQKRSHVVGMNIANAETPGFRAIGYDFEDQLQTIFDSNSPIALKTTADKHLKHNFASQDGQIFPDVFVRPTESVGHDGNTVDMDEEMMRMSSNNLRYRATVESITRKIGLLKYAVHGGRM